MLSPPVLWGDGALRAAAVHWAMLAGFGLGLLLGPVRPPDAGSRPAR